MRSIHPPDRLPPRAAFDPIDIPQLLGGIVLVTVERQPVPAPPRFLVKVAGGDVLAAAPVPMMNRYLDEVVRQNERPGAQVVLDARHGILESGCTYYWRGPPRMKFRLDFADLEYCHCPLAEDGVTVNRIISFLHYEGANPL